MTVLQGQVTTENGGRYVRQLCKHWSHKLPVDLDGDTGTVTFPGGVAMMKATPEGIALSVSGDSEGEAARLKDVVARHLDRFAFREAPLTYEWTTQ